MKTRLHLTLWLIALLLGLMGTSDYATAQTSGTFGKNNALKWEYNTTTKALTISGRGDIPDYLFYERQTYVLKMPWVAFLKEMVAVVVKEGVTSLGKGAFCDSESLVSVTLPESLRKIGPEAFANCEKLPAVKIPAGVKEVDDYAFTGCSVLAAFIVDRGNSTYSTIDGGVLINKKEAKLVHYPAGRPDKVYHIPAGIKTTANYAFDECRLNAVTFPAGMKSLGIGAFAYCEELESITFPDGFSSLELESFVGCENLKRVILLGKTPPEAQNFRVFDRDACSKATLIVPKGTKAAYAAAPEWKRFKQITEANATANTLLPEARIYTAEGRLYLTLSRTETVHVYHVSGALVRTFNAPVGETSVTLPQGVYVVRTGERTEKVLVD